MTLFDVGSSGGVPGAAGASNMQDELDALSRAIADLQSKPWAPAPNTNQTEFADESAHAASASPMPGPADTSSYGANSTEQVPGFVQEAQQQQRHRRTWRWLLWLGIPLLLIALLAQLGWMFRHELAARSPLAGKWLRAACARLHCEIKLPLNLEQLSISASRLEQAPPPDSSSSTNEAGDAGMPMTLIALLQNTSDTAQTWPALELTLRDTDGTLLVRKVFMADSYLTPNELQEGMPARSEREIRLPLVLTGEPPAGFAVNIFYP